MASKFDSKAFLSHLTGQPGIYQMIGEQDELLYIGKAQNLKKRVSSYFQKNITNSRIASLVKQIVRIDTIITDSDTEALLLENNLIKKLKPRYNVLFRDDKSYPYIYLSNHPDYPRMDFYRGAKNLPGKYFGPYPSGLAVRESLNLLQKLFKIRQCQDNFFKNRQRPCIQYQIKRCTAPCVAYVTPEQYQQQIRLAEMFLSGKDQQLLTELIKKMTESSEKLEFELASQYRDQINHLRKIQEQQYISKDGEDVDVIAVVSAASVVCIQILYFRKGRLLGNRSYFPKVPAQMELQEVLAEFLPQYYLSILHQEDLPKEILVNLDITDKTWLERVLSEQVKHKVIISNRVRGTRARWLQMALNNGNNALKVHLADRHHFYQRFEALKNTLSLPAMPTRMECFDISHTMGEATVASCVVFGVEGPLKKEYRRFNIKEITGGDDYAAMRQVLMRRYSKLKLTEALMPDLVVIDGGKGQLQQAIHVFEELQISGVLLIGIAKGPSRKPGLETLFIESKQHQLILDPESPALHLLQQIRDEAHRFAITGHKKQREKRQTQSVLQLIPGVGAERRRRLLQYFGGLQDLKGASIEQIAKVPGISRSLAARIYDSLHAT